MPALSKVTSIFATGVLRSCPLGCSPQRSLGSHVLTSGGFLPGKDPSLPPAAAAAQNGRVTASPDPGELGAFLKARRAQLTPPSVGLPDTDRHRKVTGLRREE